MVNSFGNNNINGNIDDVLGTGTFTNVGTK
jgi:hypothetical protein